LIGVLKSSASREAVGDTGGANAKRCENFDKVVGGGLAFDVGAEGKDNLGGRLVTNALDKAGDTKLIGTDVVQRSEAATQGVVEASENATALEGKNVGGLLDDAEFATLTRRLLTNLAKFLDGKKSALGTRMQAGRGERGRASEFAGPGVFMAE
jgi:hypothetical protein